MSVTAIPNATFHADASAPPFVDLSIPVSVLGLPSIDSTIGAVYIGVVIGTALFGLTVHQAYRYFSIYSDDKLYVKLVVRTAQFLRRFKFVLSQTLTAKVMIIIVLETFHSVLWSIVG
ncbi:hypothetical protein C8Q78DRAFT_1081479 [Trametes maxima]|nr:hypothetical protein C8Q78DRAFT_1081479 [Trametes maxima]